MKTLLLCRHAKSSWDDPDLTDFERPLNNRGRRDGRVMGKILRDRGIVPDLILTSPANRAMTTARMIAGALEYPLDSIVVAERIYEAHPGDLIDVAASIDDDVASAMIVGHNPGLTEVASLLCAADVGSIPTSGIVCLEFPVGSWRELRATKGTLVFFEYPKKHSA